MSDIIIHIDNKKPYSYKIEITDFKNELPHSYAICCNEDEVLNRVKDFLSKNKIENKPYTGDILFVSKAPIYFTPHKIYHIKDGIIRDNEGCTFPYLNNTPLTSFEDVKEYFSKTGRTAYNNIRFGDEDYEIIEVVP